MAETTMTTETDSAVPAASAPLSELLHRLLTGKHGPAIKEAFGSGRIDPGLVKAILSQTKLAPEQESIVELLFAGSGGTAGDGQRDAETAPATVTGDGNDLQELRQEIEDLREVNDTVAAALGACALCWGGDSGCEECAGRGKAGSALPEPRLFEKLVAPAIRRVSAVRRESSPHSRRFGS